MSWFLTNSSDFQVGMGARRERASDRGGAKVLVQNEEYGVCESVRHCTKRLRRSAREFAADHAHLHSKMPWHEILSLEDLAHLVSVPGRIEYERLYRPSRS